MNAETGGGLTVGTTSAGDTALTVQMDLPGEAHGATVTMTVVEQCEVLPEVWAAVVGALDALADRDAALARVEALHVNNDGPNDWCAGCHDQGRHDEWPCATIAAIHPAPSETP